MGMWQSFSKEESSIDNYTTIQELIADIGEPDTIQIHTNELGLYTYTWNEICADVELESGVIRCIYPNHS